MGAGVKSDTLHQLARIFHQFSFRPIHIVQFVLMPIRAQVLPRLLLYTFINARVCLRHTLTEVDRYTDMHVDPMYRWAEYCVGSESLALNDHLIRHVFH